MGTKIRTGVNFYMNLIRDTFPSSKVFQSGGSLCPHDTNDYDIVVLGGYYSDSLLICMQRLYSAGYFGSINCHTAYGDKDTDEFHTIFVCKVNGVKVDFLFASSDYSIHDIMDKYPLSIQMLSKDINGNIIYGSKYQDDPIIVFDRGKAEDKYRKYYPDKEFVYADS